MNQYFDHRFHLLASAILQCVVYADVFDYALTADQIHRYLPGVNATDEMVINALMDHRIVPGRIIQSGQYFTLPGREFLSGVRERREQNAEMLWSKALNYGRMITRLPFVRMVAVTGSLAMNNVDEQADIDYLIVTASDHLWTCRAFVIGVVRLAKAQGINICPNYLISERALAFTDRNLYTAHELNQMVLLSGKAMYEQLQAVNGWTKIFLPNADNTQPLPGGWNTATDIPENVSWLEGILSRPIGFWLEAWERERKIRKLTAQQPADLEVFFSQDICKGHFQHHGQNTQRMLRQKLDQLELEFVR